MEESVLVIKAEEFLKDISLDSISLENIDEFDKQYYQQLIIIQFLFHS